MKKAQKILGLTLALVLMFTMALSAFAAGEGSITINNAVKGQTYSVYKMLSLVPGQAPGNSYVYTVDPDWTDFISGDGADYLTVEDGTVVWTGATSDGEPGAEAVAALAQLALNYAVSEGIEATASVEADGTTVEFTNLDLGYYLVDSSLGALCGLTSTNPAATLDEKNEQPKVEKEVQEDSTEDWGDANTATIGDTVNYKTTITAQPGAENYVLHDKMEAGLTFNADSVVVMRGAAELTKGTDYQLVVPGNETTAANKCTFEIDFLPALEATLGNEEIVITYTATLNENAEISPATNDNTTWLSYGEDNETAVDKTETEAFRFSLVKTDETDTIIEGAEFRLYTDEECTAEVAVIYDSIKGYYRPVKADETGTAITAGNVVIAGLDSDIATVYYLKETQAPDGYNMITNPVTVDLKKDGVATNLDAVTANGEYTEGGIQVINDSGTLLPETGGIGTTIFYIIGGLLVVGAVIILITRKRMSVEA